MSLGAYTGRFCYEHISIQSEPDESKEGNDITSPEKERSKCEK